MKLSMHCRPEIKSEPVWENSPFLQRYNGAWIDDINFDSDEFNEMYRLAQDGYPFEIAWIGIDLSKNEEENIQFYRAFQKNLFTESDSYAKRNIDHIRNQCKPIKNNFLRRERKIAWLKKCPKLTNKVYALSQSQLFICHIDLYSKLNSMFSWLDKIDVYADIENKKVNEEWVGINSLSSLPEVSRSNVYSVFNDKERVERDLVSIGSLIYRQESLKMAKDFNITAESFNMNYSGDFIVSKAFVDFCKKNKISSFRYEPVLIEGTPIEREYSKKLNSLFEKLERTPDVFYKSYRIRKLLELIKPNM